jgi:glycosyltransferase involved in cell wall biosynthesis
LRSDKLNIIFCGNINESSDKSWGKTNTFFLDRLKQSSNVIAVIDYRVQNKLIRALNKLIGKLFYGGSLMRNKFLDGFMEKKCERKMKEIKLKPDLIIHSNSICIPESLAKLGPNVIYSDSSFTGINKYRPSPASEKAINSFNNETNKYLGRAAKVFTFNEWTRKSLISDYAVKAEKIENIGFGANLDPYYGEKNYENNLILTVLRRGTEKEKGLNLLIEGFKLAKKVNEKLTLAVVGTTGEAIDGVEYYENFPREKTIELFREASLFAMPAICEPNGMVFIEALASKTPILGLNRLAFPEFSGYGKYGFIAEENSKSISELILEAFNDPLRLKKMGIEGQEFVLAKYDWTIVVKKIVGAYENN